MKLTVRPLVRRNEGPRQEALGRPAVPHGMITLALPGAYLQEVNPSDLLVGGYSLQVRGSVVGHVMTLCNDRVT